MTVALRITVGLLPPSFGTVLVLRIHRVSLLGGGGSIRFAITIVVGMSQLVEEYGVAG